MKVWFAPYKLKLRESLGITGALDREGALLRVENANGIGHADLHPWVELGDLPLDRQLKSILERRPTSLAERSLQLSNLDRSLRATGANGFSELGVPLSHRLVGDVSRLSSQTLLAIAEEGFQTLKIKIGSDPEHEAARLSFLAAELPRFRLRLDANARFSIDGFLAFVSMLPESVKAAIEFIEDPISPTSPDWPRLAEWSEVPLAIDHAPGVNLRQLRAKWIIWKPAVETNQAKLDWAFAKDGRICVTSCLDHPVGQTFAALEAARLVGPLGTCGLNSHLIFERNEFSELLSARGPEFRIPEGTGIGFDQLLEKQNWRELK